MIRQGGEDHDQTTGKRGALAFGAAALGAGRRGSRSTAQDKGTIYYMIPTLLDEFQTETQKAIEGVFGEMGYEVVSLDAQNRPDLQLNQLEDVIQLQAGCDHHERGRLRRHRTGHREGARGRHPRAQL